MKVMGTGPIPGLEDARAHEHALGPQLHHQGGICGGGHPSGGKVHHGQTAMVVDILHQLHGHLKLLGRLIQLVLAQALDPADLRVHGPHVAHGLDHVAGARLALGADHGRPLGDAAQGLPQAPASSAILACSGVVTSIMTPPLSIWASSLFSSYLLFSMVHSPICPVGLI